MLVHQKDLRKIVRSLNPYRVIACYALFFVVRVDCDTSRDIITNTVVISDEILLRSVLEDKALTHELSNVVKCESVLSDERTQHHPKDDFPIPSIEREYESIEDGESKEVYKSPCCDNCKKYHEVSDAVPYDNLLTPIPVFSLTSSSIHNGSCRKHSRIFLHQLKRYRMWALQMFDASTKLPSGILRGNVNLFGDFDECLSVDSGILLTEEGERVRGKYCLVTVDVKVTTDPLSENDSLEEAVDLSQSYGFIKSKLADTGHFIPKFTSMNWAFCVPTTCREEDVSSGVTASLEKFNGTSGLQFAVQVEKGMCYEQNEKRRLPGATQAVLSVFGLLAIVAVVATIRDRNAKSHSPRCEGKLERMVMAFSFRKNVATLLEDLPADGDINCIYGIRALGTIALYVAHKIITLALVPYSNRIELTQASNDPLSSILRASIVYTDTFLMLSGVLTAYHLTREVARNGSINWVNRIVTRYIRLTPALIALVVFYAYVFEHIGLGPQWGRVVQQNADICKRNLWKNILYIQNFYTFQEMCATHTHQLALDMQLSLLAPLVVYILYTHPIASGLLILVFNVLSVGLRYMVAINNELSLVIYHGMPVAQLYKTANMMYSWSLYRSTPYLIGLTLGYILQKTGKNVHIPKVAVVSGWVLSAGLGYYSLLSRFPEADRNFTYNARDAAVYAAWSPLACALALAWLIYACFTGYGGPINSFLSCRALAIFSRISYAVYLTQFIVFFYNVGVTRSAERFTIIGAVNLPEVVTVVIISILGTLLFDLPMQEIKGIIVPSGSSRKPNQATRKQEQKCA
ncbi:nose resistant to fluoxetine protein 6 [Anabrus simplex]|uniref:nose resistant to fluoxetine protein 6 n=1 Tax=Anabrus simplex TaxID=316456 RepID=UPI0035A2B699